MNNKVIKPIVTEKMTALTDKFNRYGFVVDYRANKIELKKEIESLYDVTVVDINTMRYEGKKAQRYTRTGLQSGRKSHFKKAIVSLKEGDKIDFFNNI
jgi:large subunit ribosomal protein L23